MDSKSDLSLSSSINQPNDDSMPFSSPKRRLLEAKQKDAFFEKEVSCAFKVIINITKFSFVCRHKLLKQPE